MPFFFVLMAFQQDWQGIGGLAPVTIHQLNPASSFGGALGQPPRISAQKSCWLIVIFANLIRFSLR